MGCLEGVGRAAEVWMVEDVEELGSEAKPQPLGELKLPLESTIQLCSSETPQHIAPEIALLPLGRYGESCLLKILPPGYCEPKSSSGAPGTTFGRGIRAVPA